MLFPPNVKNNRFRCSFSCGHISGSFSMAKSCSHNENRGKLKLKTFELGSSKRFLTCFRKSGVKSGKPDNVEFAESDVALPPFDKLF